MLVSRGRQDNDAQRIRSYRHHGLIRVRLCVSHPRRLRGVLAQLTGTLALEAIAHGIRVNAFVVGDVVTNILNRVVGDGPGFLARHGETAPIGGAGQLEEIAEIVALLTSDRASYMVDSMVMADGGMTVTAG